MTRADNRGGTAPDANTLVELAARAEAVGNLPAHLQRGEEGMIDRAIRDLRLVPETRALRRYTSSLDAAMTLVPEGWTYRLSSPPYRKGHAADLWPPIQPGDGPFVKRADAATPALALTAACLRARAAAESAK
jgi:hypothetical protein